MLASKIIVITGIFFGFLGSVLLAIDSQKAAKNTTDILGLISKSYGYVSMSPIHDSQPIKDLEKQLKQQGITQLVAWLLITVGFLLQIISVLNTPSE